MLTPPNTPQSSSAPRSAAGPASDSPAGPAAKSPTGAAPDSPASPPTTAPQSTRPLRADAARNRALLLSAAADEFAEHGLEASVADIARRAGIGKGTVFRHFPTKDDLIAAIVLDRIEDLRTSGERLLTAGDPGDALLDFLTIAARQRQQRDLSFLMAAGELKPDVKQAQAALFQLIEDLVTRARDHGAIRTDVTGADVFLLMCAPNYVSGYVPDAAPDLWQRYLAIIFDGLRPEGAHALPQPAPNL